jgi:PA14 domain
VGRLLSIATRAALAFVVFLLALAALRWAPVHADPPFDVRALPLVAPALLLAIAAALTGGPRRPGPWRPAALGLLAALASLVVVVAARGPGGLAAEASGPNGERGLLKAGAIDVLGEDLRDLPPSRAWTLTWDGPLHVPATGAYRLWVEGSGGVAVTVDGSTVLDAAGDPFQAGSEYLLGRGEHRLHVRFDHRGPGLRLRLGWTRPLRSGRPGDSSDVLSPRYLGRPAPALLWRATDAIALVIATLAGGLAFLFPGRRRSLPLPAPVTRAEILGSLLAYAVLFAAMSWPLVLDPVHLGVVDRVDGRLNAWILAWDAHAIVHDPGGVFAAPIFHPLPDALAFTENLLLPAAVAAPLTLLGNPVLGYNALLLLTVALSGLGTELLVRRVTGDRLAAFLGGAAFALGGHRWIRMAHLHAELTWFLPLALLALDRFFEKRTWPRALLVGVALAAQGWSSIYVGAMTAATIAVGAAAAVAGGVRGRDLARLGAGLGLGALLLVPVTRPYMRMRAFEGVEFTLADQAVHATTLESYLAAPSRLYGPITRRQMDSSRVRDPLFPGLALLVLGIAGLAVAPRRYRVVALATSLAAIVISLGPETALFRWAYGHLVLLHGIRALGRFSLVPILMLSVLAGIAIAGRGRLVVLGALGLLLAESANVPLRYGLYAPPSAAARWLAGKTGAVAYLPLGGDGDTEAMLQGIAHFRPLVNGDSGFVPRAYGRALELLGGQGLSPEGLRLLRGLGVRQVVARDDLSLPVLASFGSERVFDVPPGDPARAVEAGRPASVVWKGEGATLDLGEAVPIEAVAFEIGDGPWIDRPRIASSMDGHHWDAAEGDASLGDAVVSLYRDPIHGLGEVRFSRRTARFIRLDPRVPTSPVAASFHGF